MSTKKILFISSEVYPLIKTGGLGDVSRALPLALQGKKVDVRILIPAYREALRNSGTLKVASLALADDPYPVRILQSSLLGSRVTVYWVDAPAQFDREGNPYLGPDGRDWPDNALRYTVFARSACAVALNKVGLGWLPDVVHCNDWQTGLVPALLSTTPSRPATVFTIHNMAYQGLFPRAEFTRLNLPPALWSPSGLEFHDQLSFIKGGLVYADWLTTVSPTYAREITTPEYGCGLDGLLRTRQKRLVGILNGADYEEWNPTYDPHIACPYSVQSLNGKAVNKQALQLEMGLPQLADVPLIGLVSRLVEQKGIDLVLAALPELLQSPVQMVILGSGQRDLQQALLAMGARYPERLKIRIGFDEILAHRIEAGADMFLMPSRYEPCGLNQMYSLRYGTVPVVRHTGGLADTVVDAETNPAGNGVVFEETSTAALLNALKRAMGLYRSPGRWRAVIENGMACDYSWSKSATAYLALYQQLVSPSVAADKYNA